MFMLKDTQYMEILVYIVHLMYVTLHKTTHTNQKTF